LQQLRCPVQGQTPASGGSPRKSLSYDECDSVMLRCLCLLITIQSSLAAQELGNLGEPSRPATPAHIGVSCNVQSAYTGPAPQWFNNGTASLSDPQIADLEGVLSTHPEDTCTRGYLIAHGRGHVPRRLDHVLWMIENHPEWDGFLLDTSSAGNPSRTAEYDLIKAAWLRQVHLNQRSGSVLHNAAVFFESREPDEALALLKRAIQIEPDVPFHVEGLGALYGRSQVWPKHPSFAMRAKATLLSSTDPLVVAGALAAIAPFALGMDPELGKLLLARLRELDSNRNPMDVLNDLPSRSARYTNYQCQPIPLLRKCVDH
jgi:hypothetical protein